MPPLLTEHGPADALTEHRPGEGMLFSSPRGTIVATGPMREVPLDRSDAQASHARTLPDRITRALGEALTAGQANPIAIGALPFHPAGPAGTGPCARGRIVVPRSARLLDPVRPHGDDTYAPVWPHPPTVVDEPAPAEYTDAVAAAVQRLRAGRLDKVVLARSLRVTGDAPADASALLRNLACANPYGYTFSIGLGDDTALIGASPELLVSRHGTSVTANPMAGSAPRTGDPDVDRVRADELLASGKDRYEHAVVVDAVRAGLAPLCARLDVPDEPSIVLTPTMMHLSTRIEGELRDPATTSLDLGLALHPTPAVCGAPTDAARDLIGELEPFDRGLYAGLVGWTDADGDGEWVVTIRCGIVDDDSVRLYAGAGIMADSDPDAELAETSAKFRTLLQALGV